MTANAAVNTTTITSLDTALVTKYRPRIGPRSRDAASCCCLCADFSTYMSPEEVRETVCLCRRLHRHQIIGVAQEVAGFAVEDGTRVFKEVP